MTVLKYDFIGIGPFILDKSLSGNTGIMKPHWLFDAPRRKLAGFPPEKVVLAFDGKNDRVHISNSSSLNKAFSGNQVCIILQVSPEGFDRYSDYIRARDSNGKTPRVEQGSRGVNSIQFFLYDRAGRRHRLRAGNALVKNTWNTLVCQYDGEKMEIWSNGELVNDIPVSFTLPGLDPDRKTILGGRAKMSLNTVSILNDSLSQGEIKEL